MAWGQSQDARAPFRGRLGIGGDGQAVQQMGCTAALSQRVPYVLSGYLRRDLLDLAGAIALMEEAELILAPDE